MTILTFILFNLIVYLIGRGFLIIINLSSQNFNYIENKQFLNIEIKYYFPILTLFLIGNLTVLINFFLPVKIEYLFIISSILILFNLKNLKSTFKNEYKYFYFILFPALLSISSYSIKFAGDAGLYHLNTQAWIKQEKIHLSLVSLHSRYGYSSIFDYIASNFWLENNFILLHFLNLIFINLFFFILFRNLLSKENSYMKNLSFLLVLFGSLDNFGLGGGRNGFIDLEAITKFDSVFAIMFFITGLGLIDILKSNKKDVEYFLFLTTLTIFTVQLRIFGYVLLFLYFFYIYRNLNSILNYLKNKNFKILLLIYLIWEVKNILISGCLIFPQPKTCFNNLSWSNKNIVISESTELQNFHISYNFEDGIQSWFQNWLTKPINKNVLYNFIFSFLVIYFLNKILFKKKKGQQLKFPFLLIVFYIFSLLVWILSSPGIRFALGFLILSFYFISYKYDNFEFRYNFVKKYQILIFLIPFIFSLTFLLRIEFYQTFVEAFPEMTNINIPNVKYSDNVNGWGVVNSDNSSSCWINTRCLPNNKKVELVKNKYNMFKLLD